MIVEKGTLDQLRRTASARRFLGRARAVLPTFKLTANNAEAVARMCQRLDGLPLAIELAAAWTSVLAPAKIAARLDDRLQLLTLGSRAAPRRHPTLRATLDWSHALLTPPDQVLFRRLAVFAGGFTLEAAQTACAGDELSCDMLLPLLARLTQKSLVVADTRGASARYHLLETVREYALLQLTTHDHAARWHARHADWCLTLVGTASRSCSAPRS